MAVTVADFVQRDISDRAVARACHYAQVSLTHTYNRMGSPYFDRRLLKIVIGVAAEAAFLDWLQEMQIAYDLKGRTRWYEADRSDIVIAGCRCDLKTLAARQLPTNLSDLLNWCVLVPVDQVKHAEVYVFGYVIARTDQSTAKAQSLLRVAGNYRWLTHVPWQRDWHRREDSLGRLSCRITDSADAGATIELGGTELRQGKRIAFWERITLSTTPQQTQQQFHELLYVRWLAEQLPRGTIVIEAGMLRECIPPIIGFTPNRPLTQPPLVNGWYDIWLYDAKAIFVGWASQATVRQWPVLPPHRPCPPVQATQTRNYHGFVRQLQPLSALAQLRQH